MSGGLGEFELIRRFFQRTAAGPEWLVAGIGDDTALIRPPGDFDIAATLDTLNAGVHFPESLPAAAVGHRALAVNLSDLASMGATPAWALLSLSLPEPDPDWLAPFAQGFFDLADRFGVVLAGGDTVCGPLAVSVQLNGWVRSGAALRRGGAKSGDRVYVTGSPGEAAAGLALMQGEIDVAGSPARVLTDRFCFPQPRVREGATLAAVASACIDVSDGLAADGLRLAEASGCGLALDLGGIPLSDALLEACGRSDALRLALGGGDDYELVFTVPASRTAQFEALADDWAVPWHRIGRLSRRRGLRDAGDGSKLTVPGWDHFRAGDVPAGR